jgi:hypothetical protein
MPGLYGQGNGGIGVFGRSKTNTGVFGLSDSSWGAHGASTSSIGVHGYSFNNTGVFGLSDFGWGVHGASTYSLGVHGYSERDTGVFGLSRDHHGVYGKGGAYGVFAEGGHGVVARGNNTGVVANGAVVGVLAYGPSLGVHSSATSEQGGIGVMGTATPGGIGVFGRTYPYGGRAGYFDGSVIVNGDLTVQNGNKLFKIDHPLDPQNKYLLHNAVESSERKNVYDGVAQLDEDGSAWVDLPEWFEALNGDFRYQLTAVGAAAPNLHVAEEIYENRFRIAGGEAGMRVCWQVTGSRKDPWAAANPFEVEEEKSPEDRGHYLQPDLYNAPEEQRVRIGPMEEERLRQMPPGPEPPPQTPQMPSGPEPPPQGPQMPPSFVLDMYEENRQQINELRRQIEELRRQR